MSVTSNH